MTHPSSKTLLHKAMLLMDPEVNEFIVAPVGSSIVMKPPAGYIYSTGACWVDYPEKDEDWQYVWWCTEVLSNPHWNGGLLNSREESRAVYLRLRNKLEENIIDLPRPFPRYPDELCDKKLLAYITNILQKQRDCVSSNETFNDGQTGISWAIETSRFWHSVGEESADIFRFQYPLRRRLIDKNDATGPCLLRTSLRRGSTEIDIRGIERWAAMANAVPMMLNTINAQAVRIAELEALAMSADAGKDL